MTTELFVERAKLREAINAELVEFTGEERYFIWTDDTIITYNGKRWHELKIIDTQMICYATLNTDGSVTVVNEEEEIYA